MLDLGAGRGAATLPLAEAIGPTGSVTAVDVSSRMVALLTTTLSERGLTNVEAVEHLFRTAGFGDVRTERATYAVPYRDVEQLRTWSLGTALRGLWMHVPEAEVPAALERIDAQLAKQDYAVEVDIRYTLARD